MGLAAQVYKNIEIVDETKFEDVEDVWDECDFEAFVVFDGWDDRISQLQRGAYYKGDYVKDAYTDSSYGGYNMFRTHLARLSKSNKILDKDGNIDWNSVHSTPDTPFYKLIDFSDCEGCIDWVASEEILKDFDKYKDDAVEYFDSLPDTIDFYKDVLKKQYNQWHNIFQQAVKHKGVVNFQ